MPQLYIKSGFNDAIAQIVDLLCEFVTELLEELLLFALFHVAKSCHEVAVQRQHFNHQALQFFAVALSDVCQCYAVGKKFASNNLNALLQSFAVCHNMIRLSVIEWRCGFRPSALIAYCWSFRGNVLPIPAETFPLIC